MPLEHTLKTLKQAPITRERRTENWPSSIHQEFAQKLLTGARDMVVITVKRKTAP